MRIIHKLWFGVCVLLAAASAARAEVKITIDRNDTGAATPQFKFAHVPRPAVNDAAAKAKFTVVDGQRDQNGGNPGRLHDGRLPNEADQPSANFFFAAGSDGGRIQIELESAIDIKQVNTYSWHTDGRAPQVYKLYASDGKAGGFNAQPKRGTDPVSCGWKLVATVDTRTTEGNHGGQYGVSIGSTEDSLGKFQYLLFDIARTEEKDPFGHTFYSEIDVIDRNAPASTAIEVPEGKVEVVQIEGGKYTATIDTTTAPELTEWAHKELAPVIQKFYPKIVALLPSEGYEAPTKFSILFSPEVGGVAATGGTRISGSAKWYQQNLGGEAVGSIVHEMVHVVQQYGRARRNNANATRSPGWLVEGLADYIRWYEYEPESHGAEISKRGLSRARYDASYRVTANFLHWVAEKYDKDIAKQMNAAMRDGKYDEGLWKQYTGHTAPELGTEWKAALADKLGVKLAAETDAKINLLTEDEKKAGWKLLFDGKDFDGWHNFKREGVRAGWQVQDSTLACVDPHNAGDLCTNEKYDWFELELEYNISEAGNSGIMFHVTNDGDAAWASGPEFQLEDNVAAADGQRCGWLYGLYKPAVDPATGKPLDATKPVGEWNHVRLVISPEKCEHVINGVKYFEYVLGSDDFKERVAKSKFRSMPFFAKSPTGFITLQGDHGQVSFRNIKVRPLPGPKQ